MGRNKQTKDNFILTYYQAIKAGRVTVGRYIERLYEIIVKGIESKEYVFDQKKANDAIEWFEAHCFHTEGDLAPGNIKLELWQKAMMSCIYGLLDPKTGKRQFREVVLIVARKNGKSLVSAGICKHEWEKSGYGARVFCIAPKLEQADIVYNNVWQMVVIDPEYQALKLAIDQSRDEHNKRTLDDSELPRHRRTDLLIPVTNSTVKKIAFSAKKSDGFNPSLCVCDEIAAWQGDQGLKQYEVMKSGMGARPEGFMLSCTTAGYINDSIYDELLKRSTRFLMGESKERRLLPFLYIIDDPQKWNDINELRKSNPNLGVSISVDYLLEEIAIAEGSLSRKAEFLCKMCNIKQNSSLAWLPSEAVAKTYGEPLRLEDFRNTYCVGGIDLSQTTDLTSCCVVIERQGRLYVFSHFFLPAEKLEDAIARDGVPYRAYIERGFLSLSGENFVDYNDCFRWFVDLIENYQIYPLQIGYDRFSAQYLIQQLNQYGAHTDDVYQGWNLSPVIKEAEGLIKDGVVCIGDNDLLKMHLLDTALKMDTETNKVKMVKLNSNSHIDGAAALIDALTVRQKWYAEIGSQLKNED